MAAEDRDLNRDPLTDEPGSHPVGTGVGAAGGAVAGAAVGAVGGPIGMAVGGVVGALVGGLAGRATAEAVNPTAEEEYWRENYDREPYHQSGRSFDDYGPAYRHGLDARSRHDDWDAVEPQLASEWETRRGSSSLDWESARPASRAAWDRVDPHYRNEGDGDLSHYGTGLVSSDSSYYTGGPGNTADDRATVKGTRADRQDDRQAADSYVEPARMDTTSTMGGGALGATSGMDSPFLAGTTTAAATGFGVGAAVGGSQQAGNASINRDEDRDDAVDVLKDLVETCKDGEYGFQQCADHADRADLRSMFRQRAEDCRRGAQQLQDQIRSLGGHVPEGGSMLGAMHRGWVSTRAAMSGQDDKAMLEEAERGEDKALATYRKALQKPLPEHVRQLVQQQCDGVQRNHDEVKRLRNELRAQG